MLGLSVFSPNQGRLIAILNDLTTQELRATRESLAERERERMTLATNADGVGRFQIDAASAASTWNAQTFALRGRPELADPDPEADVGVGVGVGVVRAVRAVRAVRDAALTATDRARFDTWAQALLSGGDRSIEFEAIWPEGTQHWLSARGRPRADAACSAASILGVMWDVSDLVKAWSALRESAARYARAMRGTSDGSWEWDVRSGEAYLSLRWKELLG